MLRLAVARSNSYLEQGLRSSAVRQWQQQRPQQPLRIARAFADRRPVDQTIIPKSISQTGNIAGEQTITVAGVPTGPIQATATTNPTATSASTVQVPKTPPTAAEVQANVPSPSTNTGKLPPTGTGTASTGPTAAPPPPYKRPRRRARNFLFSLVILSALGYAGGVYYSLISDNFHDFFTEYIPYGEDAVAYFEEREFQKRFPTREASSKSWPQVRGENKITIGRSSGLSARVADSDNAGSDLGAKGRHVSAVEDNRTASSSQREADKHKQADEKTGTKPELAKAKAEASQPKTTQAAPPSASPPASTQQAEAKAKADPVVTTIDHINVAEAQEPVVQDLVKLLNNVITAIGASPEASKYVTTISTAKEQLTKVIADVSALKEQAAHEAQSKLKDAHAEFDTAAKELVRRLESEMKEQELKWREEYESERENLSRSYQQKLAAELDVVRKLSGEENKKALLEQEIALQKKFMGDVQSQVESEREGRLAKLDELASSVDELEKLTGEWNGVVDATLQTQHVQVALEAVRAKLHENEHPTPFLDELVALKEVSKDDDVVNAAIASMNPVAYQRGIPSIASLIDRFRRVASEVRKASLLPEDAGVASHAASAVLSRLMFAKKTDRGLPEGDDVEATLARTEVLLEEGDLDAAAREMNALKGWAGVLSRDWVAECRRVLEVRQAVDVIATEARLQSLLVE